jgi:L-lactate dehydrogenase complex protein LldE
MVATRPKVGLFVTCLVDLMRPAVAFAAVKLLEDAGCEVAVPAAQTCCGQPAYNSGDTGDAAAIARPVVEAFEHFDYMVVPSGSCAGTIKVHYLEMFAGDPDMLDRAARLSARTYELTTFLHEILKGANIHQQYRGVVTYHDSCSGLRELGIGSQPRALLSGVAGLELREMRTTEVCCGFGGLFCVKYPEISEKMVDAKVADIIDTEADTLLGGDLGCLLNMAGRLHRLDSKIKVRHVAEVLAGLTDEVPPIGEAG